MTRPLNSPLSAPARPATVDRQQLHDELRQRRETFHAILDSSSTHELLKPSNGTRWNNEELLFHMLFGYIVVVALIRMIKVLGLLPRPATKPFAFVLNASSRPFNAINYWGSRLAAKVYNHRRMGPKFDRVAASLATTLDRTSEASLRRGMHYPTRWDPFFREYMTLADVFHYPTQHFDFHQRQLQMGLGAAPMTVNDRPSPQADGASSGAHNDTPSVARDRARTSDPRSI